MKKLNVISNYESNKGTGRVTSMPKLTLDGIIGQEFSPPQKKATERVQLMGTFAKPNQNMTSDKQKRKGGVAQSQSHQQQKVDISHTSGVSRLIS